MSGHSSSDDRPRASEDEVSRLVWDEEREAVDPATVESSQTGGDRRAEPSSNGLQVCCPHCESFIELATEASLAEIVCTCCGSSFSLVDDPDGTLSADTFCRIGHFEVVEKLGMGAFGTVWKARDTVLERTVAIKVPRRGELDSRESERFLREARAVAQLNHQNIVPIHEVGREGNSLYIVSDFVRGVPLSDWLADRKPTQRGTAELAAKVAAALHHAHEAGVIHRDLKPANILIDDDGEPYVTDFGLAKRQAAEETMTVEGTPLGTPAYMSPEQAKGDLKRIDRRSDVYALGVVLFEMLTGERPFRGTPRMVQHKKINEEPPSPRQMDVTISKDLETICLKCLARLPEHRYTTAEEVAEDLRRCLEGRPITARPVSRLERALRWSQRRPAVAALLAAVMLVSSIAATAITLQWRANVETNRRLVRRVVDSYVTSAVANQKNQLHEIVVELPTFTEELSLRLEQQPVAMRERVLLQLALLRLRPELANKLLDAYLTMGPDTAQSVNTSLLLKELVPYSERLAPRLWQTVLEPEDETTGRRWIRAAAALAALDADNDNWIVLANQLSERLLALGNDQADWIDEFFSVRSLLFPQLKQYFETGSDAERSVAARALATYAADQPESLLSLLYIAVGDQHDVLVQALGNLSSDNLNTALVELQGRALDDTVMGLPGEQGEELVQQRANAALALLALDRSEVVWPLFAQQPDPRLQTYLIHGATRVQIPVALLIDRAQIEHDPDALFTLILAIGRYDPSRQISPGLVDKFEDWLRKTYTNHPDSGIHCAVRWVLQRWGHIKQLEEANARLAELGVSADRDWYHNSLGQMMVIIRDPQPFEIGSPAGIAAGSRDGPRQRVTIPHAFAIAATETTRREFDFYSPPEDSRPDLEHASSLPTSRMSWYHAIGYCQWLTERESLLGGIRLPVDFNPDHFEQPELVINLRADNATYRLPTEAEWEYACRAGSTTSRYFGGANTRLGSEHANVASLEGRWVAVGQFMPNRLGLFDMYGNVNEWTLDVYNEGAGAYDTRTSRTVSHTSGMVVRGGGFSLALEKVRTAHRQKVIAYYQSSANGFRIARAMR